MSVAVQDAEQTTEEPAARVTARKMFRYSEFLDVGEGAEECEHGRDGKCEDIEHFHAWCRLPNPYQHQDIRSKALAAKARRIRALKDPASDDSVVLDQGLEEVNDSVFVDAVIDELLARDWAEDYYEAMRNVGETDEFEHFEQDREEFSRLSKSESSLGEEEQSGEFKRLGQHMTAYAEAMQAEMKRIQEPKRAELRARPLESIIGLARSRRVDEEADIAFRETYNAWMWFVGTYQVELHPTLGRPHKLMWPEIGGRDRAEAGTMFAEAPEVIDALKKLYTDLQVALQQGSAGN